MLNDNENVVTAEEVASDVETVELRTEPETAEAEIQPIPDDLELICARERADREYDEFKSLFPEMSVSDLPDSVRESVRAGIPLCAACALYERRRAAALAEAERANAENRERSFALHSDGGNGSYFTPDEVKEMSSAEVRKNYKRIIESMNHWN